MDFIYASWYFVPAIIIASICGIVSIAATLTYFSLSGRYDSADRKHAAGIALVAFCMLVFGAWIWPLVLPVVICFILFKMVGEFISFPKKEN